MTAPFMTPAQRQDIKLEALARRLAHLFLLGRKDRVLTVSKDVERAEKLHRAVMREVEKIKGETKEVSHV